MNKFFIVLLFLITPLVNWGQGFQEVTFPSLPMLKNSALLSIDLDADGQQDIVVAGEDENGSHHLSAFRYNEGAWENWSNGLSAVQSPKLFTADFNNDGKSDLVVCGVDADGNGVVKLFKHDGNGNWSDETSGLPQLKNAAVYYEDLRAEGEKGLLITGENDSENVLQYFIYDPIEKTWFEKELELPAITSAEIVVFDANLDGYLDVFLGGEHEFGGNTSQLFLNEGNGNWSPASTSFALLNALKVKTIDANSDGRMDVILTGFGNGGVSIATLYLNLASGWSAQTWDLPQIGGGDIVVTDLNGDNKEDIILSGIATDGTKQIKVLYNDDTKFIDSGIGLTAISGGDLLFTDWNNDGKLDLICTGESYFGTQTITYNNQHLEEQTALSAPTNLNAITDLNTVSLTWDNAADTRGSVIALGTSSGVYDLLWPITTNNNGRQNFSNLEFSNSKKINALAEGQYHWKVITAGVNKQLSSYSNESVFTICDKPDLGEDISVCSGIPFTLTEGSATDRVTWSLLDGTVIGSNTQLETSFTTTSSIVVAVEKEIGCIVKDTITVNILSLPEINTQDQEICYLEQTQLQIPGDWQQVNWYEEGIEEPIKEDEWFLVVDVLETKTYVAEIINNNGCVGYDTVIVEMLPLPEFDLGLDLSICEGDEFSLEIETISDVTSIEWYTEFTGILPDQTSLTYSNTVFNDEKIWAIITNAKGCVYSDTIRIQKMELPTFNLGGDKAICFKEEYSFHIGSENDNVEWFSKKLGTLIQGNAYTHIALENDSLWCKVTNDKGCSWADTIAINVLELPQINLPETIEICYQEQGDLTVEGDWKEINWYLLNGEKLSEQPNPTYTFTANNNQEIVAEVYSWEGCVAYDTTAIEVIALPIAKAGEDHSICTSGEVVIGENTETNYTYSWYPTEGLNDPYTSQPLASPQTTTVYYLTVTSAKGCVSLLDSVNVSVDEFYAVNAGDDQEICIGEGVELGGYPLIEGEGNDYTFLWQPFIGLDDDKIAHPFATPTTTQEYIVTASLGDCISYQDTVIVKVNPLPEITISEDVAIGYKGEITLSASGGEYYLWYPDYNIDRPNIATPTVHPEVTTTYTVEVMTAKGCTATEEVTVYVGNEVFVPNLFTPNNDGNNDTFLVYGKGIKTLSIKVTDQKGTVVYFSNTKEEIMEKGWNGTNGTVVLPNGTYYWKLQGEYEDGSKVSFKGGNTGTINLLR